MKALKSFAEVKNLLHCHPLLGVYLFIGNGPKLQYASLDQVGESLTPVLSDLNQKHGGPGRWLAVYGGDTWRPDSPALGAVMEFVKTRFGPVVMSVQSWPEEDTVVD